MKQSPGGSFSSLPATLEFIGPQIIKILQVILNLNQQI